MTYPRDPCGGAYEIGRPLVAAANLTLGGGRSLAVVARGQAPDRAYVRRATVDGAVLQRTHVRHDELAGGPRTHHVLAFEMVAAPPAPPLGREYGPW